MRFEDFYSNTQQSKQIKNLQESKVFKKLTPDEAFDKALNLWVTGEQIPKVLEDIIATDPFNASMYAREIVKGRWPQGEETILNSEYKVDYINFLKKIGYEDLEESTSNNPYKYLSTDQAYDLAINLSSTNKPVPKELEEIIAKDPHNAYFYAKYVVKGRFPQGEPMIMSNLDAKANYIRFLNKIGYEDLEESFENFFNSNIQESNTPLTPKEAYEWALRFDRLGSKIPKEMEDVIAKDAKASLKYALHVKRARFEKGEPVIATDPEMSYNYAIHIINGRFPEGEEVIMRSIQKDAYVRFLREINYSDVEESFVNFFNSNVNESFIPDDPEEAYELAKNYKYANKQIPEELENVLAESPKYSYMYAKYILNGPFKKGEPVIIQSYTYALDYARKVLKGRFPLGEELLSKDPDFAFLYARDVLKGRFPEGEEAIMSLYHTKRDYIKFLKYIGYEDIEESTFTKGTLMDILNVVRGLIHKNLPIPDKMINAIASDAFTSHIYARDIIEEPFPEGEKAIAKDGYWSCLYAIEVIKGRFPEGEEAIFRSMYKDDYLDYLREIKYQDLEESFEQFFTEAKGKVRKPNKEERTDPLSAAIYASEVVQGRVPELEPLILTDYAAIAQYIWFTIKGRWKEAEETIANSEPSGTARYAAEILKDRWINIPDIPKEIALQAEENIINDPWIASVYAQEAIKGRWPEAEETILSEPDSKEEYINFLKSINHSDLEESYKLR